MGSEKASAVAFPSHGGSGRGLLLVITLFPVDFKDYKNNVSLAEMPTLTSKC
jgi:hypothetical protein